MKIVHLLTILLFDLSLIVFYDKIGSTSIQCTLKKNPNAIFKMAYTATINRDVNASKLIAGAIFENNKQGTNNTNNILLIDLTATGGTISNNPNNTPHPITNCNFTIAVVAENRIARNCDMLKQTTSNKKYKL